MKSIQYFHDGENKQQELLKMNRRHTASFNYICFKPWKNKFWLKQCMLGLQYANHVSLETYFKELIELQLSISIQKTQSCRNLCLKVLLTWNKWNVCIFCYNNEKWWADSTKFLNDFIDKNKGCLHIRQSALFQCFSLNLKWWWIKAFGSSFLQDGNKSNRFVTYLRLYTLTFLVTLELQQ